MDRKIKILIVEDDENISQLIEEILDLGGYEGEKCFDGASAIEYIRNNSYDLILLDIMLPEIDGFSVMESTENLSIPIIFLTAKNSLEDKLRGLKGGAEDYIVKPFEAMELLARIEVVLRRNKKIKDKIFFDNMVIYYRDRRVLLAGKEIQLTSKEFELLYFLVSNKNLSFSREQLLDRVWGESFFGHTRTVDTHIAQLRKKCGLHDKLVTITKYGYRLEE